MVEVGCVVCYDRSLVKGAVSFVISSHGNVVFIYTHENYIAMT